MTRGIAAAKSRGRGKALIETRDAIRGTITRIIFTKNGWTAGRMESEGKSVSFVGSIVVSMGQPVVLHGSWETHPKYGRQFAAVSVELDREMDTHGLARYLASNPAFKHIGQARAWQIAETFGKDFERVLLDAPEKIAEVAKVPCGTVLELQKSWIESQAINKVMVELAAYELTHHQAKTVTEAFGANAVGLLLSNPYLLIREIRGFGFKRVDKIALRAGVAKDNPNRINAGVLHVVAEELDAGHTWTEYNTLIDMANTVLIMDNLDSKDIIGGYIDNLIDSKALAAHGAEAAIMVGFPVMLEAEKELAQRFIEPGGGKVCECFSGYNRQTISQSEPLLNPEQIDAVLRALTSSISVITGGAGTGKTFAVNTICNLAEEAGLSVVLCAPTGKAAKRMEETTGRNAWTVHRLLGFRGEDVLSLDVDMIDADMLVVDEVSMLDIPLAVALMRAVDSGRTSVVFVGDHNQLPPVGPGSVLRDLIESNVVPVTTLTTVVRQAGVLKENSTAILAGDVRPTSVKPAPDKPADWYVIGGLSTPDDVRNMIWHMYAEWIPVPLDFNILHGVQVLTPTHKGEAGTVELNRMLQKVVQQKVYGRAVEDSGGKRAKPLPGDKVIQMVNDYETGLMNGTVGILRERVKDKTATTTPADPENDLAWLDEMNAINEAESKPAHYLELDDGTTVDIPDEALCNLELAYAITIHKAQGSEFPCAVVVCHKAHSFMHHRNLLYTGVTRAKKCAIILGDSWGIGNCARRVMANSRRTFLPTLLDGVTPCK
jgi:exodeoxyribonuclease V alpha subunit